jgi:hypothetical protein
MSKKRRVDSPVRKLSDVSAVAPPVPTVDGASSPLDALLRAIGRERGDARRLFDDLNLSTADKAYRYLVSQGRVPAGMTLEEFTPLYGQVVA